MSISTLKSDGFGARRERQPDLKWKTLNRPCWFQLHFITHLPSSTQSKGKKKDGKRRGKSRALYYWNLLTAYQPNWHLIILSLDEIYGTIQWRSLVIVTIKKYWIMQYVHIFSRPCLGICLPQWDHFPTVSHSQSECLRPEVLIYI